MSAARKQLCTLAGWWALACALLLLSSTGCTSTTLSYRLDPAAPGQPSGAFLAGAAACDITPCPGYATAGHSTEGAIGNGRWMRMQARAIYLEDDQGSGAALVSCDLWAMAEGLSDRVAQLVHARVPSLDRNRLLIVATHSHQSPGGYATSGLYSVFASKQMGFDPTIFEFLAKRIAQAVTDAYAERAPADMTYHVVRSQAFSRNRSFPAFRVNPEAEQVIAEGGTDPTPTNPRTSDEHKAVDTRLRVLRITSAEETGTLKAAAVFLAVHATAMPNYTPLYQPDLYGIAADITERSAGAGSERPVIALFPSALGDVSPDWCRQGVPEARRLGGLVAEDIQRALASPGDPVSGAVRCRTCLAPMANQRVCCGPPGSRSHRTGSSALAGMAMLGGAEDGRSALYDLGWREGVRGSGPPGHGCKYPALGLGLPGDLGFGFTQLLIALAPPPACAYLGLYELGSVTLATFPAEPTTVLGRRTEQAVLRAYGESPPRDVVVVGMANGYVSYLTTPEEYQCQHYEGASTLFGQYVGPLLVQRLAALAGGGGNCAAASPRCACYKPGSCSRASIRDASCIRSVAKVLETLGVCEAGSLPTFRWNEPWAPWPPAQGCGVWPRIRIEVEQGGSWSALETPEGVEDETTRRMFVLVTSVDRTQKTANWQVVWSPPALPAGAKYRFAVTSTCGSAFHSPVFTLD